MLLWTDCSLIGNAPEHDVIQQRDLFSQLHGRERLETLSLRVLRLQINTLGLRTGRRLGNRNQGTRHTARTSSDEECSYRNEVQQRGAFLEMNDFDGIKTSFIIC